MRKTLGALLLMASLPTAAAGATRTAGPAGSIILVDESHVVPLVHLEVAARGGASGDPRGQEGLINLAAELARRGAAGRTRQQMDEALEALGGRLDAIVEADSVRLQGHVLARNFKPFLDLVADIILRADFKAAEFTRTRREILAQMDELRNDDRTLCARFFERRLYGDHPYGQAADGTAKSLAKVRREDAQARFKAAFTGNNLIFAAAGDITPDAFKSAIGEAFARLPPGARATGNIRTPLTPDGWRIQLVDKPDRTQTQIMIGHPTIPASHPDFLPLALAFAAFGGRGMKATLMDEMRTKRGLAYGAYMGILPRRGPSAVRGWVFTGVDRTVTTLKLILRLYRKLMKEGVSAQRLRFFQSFLAGTHASEMDAPEQRLAARVSAELEGLPEDFVDTYVDRIKAITPEQVASAIKTHVKADNLAITLVATADTLAKLLVRSGIDPNAIDIVKYDSY